MGFIRDMMGGGGDLYQQIVPSEIRKLVPKEIAPGGFDPARDWFGFDIKDPNKEKATNRAYAAQLAQAQQGFANSANQPIPGLTGPTTDMPPQGLLAKNMLMNPNPMAAQMLQQPQGLLAEPQYQIPGQVYMPRKY